MVCDARLSPRAGMSAECMGSASGAGHSAVRASAEVEGWSAGVGCIRGGCECLHMQMHVQMQRSNTMCIRTFQTYLQRYSGRAKMVLRMT